MNSVTDVPRLPVILITGKNGQVGWELQRSLLPLGRVVACDRNEMDLSNSDSLRNAIQKIKPDIIVNAAAYTAVDNAEKEPDVAMQINGIAPGVIAEEAERLGALLIHYSTDYVFNGSKSGSYTELDVPDPINEYGKSKLAGEAAIEATKADYLILRTSWVYAQRGKNFLLSMLRLGGERKELAIVNDQFGAPTTARYIADVTARIIQQSILNRQDNNFESGLFHLTSVGKVSWYEFAVKLFELSKKYLPEHQNVVESLLPIQTKDYPTPATRPVNSCLSNKKLVSRFGVYGPAWDKLLELCIQDFK